ncbi:MAG TPA: DUF1599 domain-containing protein [Bacteroidetes bacterium]|nr:DUF1599 domain-containing protein [Bacteroidota bacterium]
MVKTLEQYDELVLKAKETFQKKMKDYGPTWRIFRLGSIIDQLFIKAKRIRSIQMAGESKVKESIEGEFFAIYNYSIMALIQNDLGLTDEPDIAPQIALNYFDEKSQDIKNLMLAKNHDYGEAWRDMKVSSMTDIILVKIYRIKQILENDGKTLVSEGIDSNLMDIANYAIFALILINEKIN